jgi:hypothetical protein
MALVGKLGAAAPGAQLPFSISKAATGTACTRIRSRRGTQSTSGTGLRSRCTCGVDEPISGDKS